MPFWWILFFSFQDDCLLFLRIPIYVNEWHIINLQWDVGFLRHCCLCYLCFTLLCSCFVFVVFWVWCNLLCVVLGGFTTSVSDCLEDDLEPFWIFSGRPCMFVFLHFRSIILKTIIVEVLRIKFDSSPTLSKWNILQNYSRSKHMRWSPKQQRQQKPWSFRKLDEWWDDVPVQQKQDFHAIRKYEGKNNSKGWFFLDLLGGQKNNWFDLNTDKFSWMMGFVLWALVWCDLAEYSFLLCVFFLAFCFPLFLWLTLFSHRWPNKVLEKTLWSSRCVLIGLKMLNITTRLVFRAVLRTISLLRIVRNKHRLCWPTNQFLNTKDQWNVGDCPFGGVTWLFKDKPPMNLFVCQELSCQSKHFPNFFCRKHFCGQALKQHNQIKLYEHHTVVPNKGLPQTNFLPPNQMNKKFKKGQFVLTTNTIPSLSTRNVSVLLVKLVLMENSMLIWSGVLTFRCSNTNTEYSFLNTTHIPQHPRSLVIPITQTLQHSFSIWSLDITNLRQDPSKRTCLRGLVNKSPTIFEVRRYTALTVWFAT